MKGSDRLAATHVPSHFAASFAYAALLSTSSAQIPNRNDLALRALRPQARYASTEPSSTPSSSASPPPPVVKPSSSTRAVGHVPPPGSPPPAPPAPLDAAPPKVADLAAESKEQEQAIAKKEKKEKLPGTWGSRTWEKVKKEAAHYWHGTKLLGQEIKISAKLQYKVLQGGTLTRRERRQVRSPSSEIWTVC